MTRTTRIVAGRYEVTDGERTVTIIHNTRAVAGYNGWIAAANWSRDYLTDPVETKREAVYYALEMLANPDCN